MMVFFVLLYSSMHTSPSIRVVLAVQQHAFQGQGCLVVARSGSGSGGVRQGFLVASAYYRSRQRSSVTTRPPTFLNTSRSSFSARLCIVVVVVAPARALLIVENASFCGLALVCTLSCSRPKPQIRVVSRACACACAFPLADS